MTLILTLPVETERRLRLLAAVAGVDVETSALQTLEEKVRSVQLPAFDEVDTFIEVAIAEVRRERRDDIAPAS